MGNEARLGKRFGIIPLFEHAVRAIQGGRNYQEDASAAWVPPTTVEPAAVSRQQSDGSGKGDSSRNAAVEVALLGVLADGMGGHAGGALASTTACEVFVDKFTQNSKSVPARLYAGLMAANHAIEAEVTRDPSMSGMGCTLVGVAFSSSGAQWISVGDSPLYLFRAGELAVLNEDHSMAPVLDKMAQMGEISKRDAKADGRRHFLRSAVSGGEIEMIDRSVMPLPLEEGDYVIASSDGIQTLDDSTIETCISAHEKYGPGAVGDALIKAVEDAGNTYQDNTTILAVRVAGKPAHGTTK